MVFLVLYLRTDYPEFNKFLLFPIIQVLFGVFYLAFRTTTWVTDDVMEFGEWVYALKPVVEVMGFVALVVGRFRREGSSETHTLITERKNTMERSEGAMERSLPPMGEN